MLISVVAYPFQHESVRSRTVQRYLPISQGKKLRWTVKDSGLVPGLQRPVLGFPEWPTSDSPRGFTAAAFAAS